MLIQITKCIEYDNKTNTIWVKEPLTSFIKANPSEAGLIRYTVGYRMNIETRIPIIFEGV